MALNSKILGKRLTKAIWYRFKSARPFWTEVFDELFDHIHERMDIVEVIDFVITSSVSYTVPEKDTFVMVDTQPLGGPYTVNLPATPFKGQYVVIKDVGGNAAAGNEIFIDSGVRLIEGIATGDSITGPYGFAIYMYEGGQWVRLGGLVSTSGGGGGGASPDELVSVSAGDTASGYLEDKIVAGSNIVLATLNSGGDEDLEIALTGTRAGFDSTAIHDNVSGELALISAKAIPTGSDALLIEDAADGNSKKRITISDLPFSPDDKVGVSANDTTPGYLAQKIVAGTNIAVTEIGDGGDEDLEVALTGTQAGFDDTAIHDDTAGEIAGVAAKAVPTGADLILIEDAAAANAKKRTTIGAIDHDSLTNTGTNTHAQIDSHIADGTIHFTEASIDHTSILNVGTNTHAQIDSHIADAAIHVDWSAPGAGTVDPSNYVDSDELSKVSVNDMTAGYLEDKTVGAGVAVLQTLNEAANEQRQVAVFPIREGFVVSDAAVTAYTLTVPLIEATQEVYLNGQRLRVGAGNDYTVAGNIITLLKTLFVGDFIGVSYYSTEELPDGAPDFSGVQRYELAADLMAPGDGSSVTSAELLGGSGIVVSPTSAAGEPIWYADVGGGPAIKFTVDDFLEATGLSLDWTSGHTGIFVFQSTRYNTYGGLIVCDNGASAISDNALEVYWNSESSGKFNLLATRRDPGTAYDQTGAVFVVNREHIATYRAHPTDPGIIYRDDDPTNIGTGGTDLRPPTATFSRLQIGVGYSDNEANMYLRAGVLYDAPLADIQIAEVWNNLKDRFPSLTTQFDAQAPDFAGATRYEWAADAFHLREGDLVSTWPNVARLTGFEDLGQTGTLRGTFRESVGGYPAVEFGTDGHVYVTSAAVVDLTSGYTLITYLEPTNTDVQEWAMLLETGASNPLLEARIHQSGSPYSIRGYNRQAAATLLSNSVFERNKEIVTFSVGAGSAKIYRGTTDVTASGGATFALPAGNTNRIQMGHALFSTSDFVGHMYAMVLYDRELSAVEVADVVANLESRFGPST